MKTSDVLSIIAIVMASVNLMIGRYFDHFLYGPKCNISVFSIPKGFHILLENAGNRIISIKRVTYICSDAVNNQYTDNLSRFFYSLPCESRRENRPKDEILFPNSKQKLIETTFYTQDNLEKAWETVGKITVKVEYHGLIRRFFPTIHSLKPCYETFLDAMKDENENMRKLNAFK